MFHDGMRELQDKYGGRKVADAIAKHRTHVEFSDDDRAYIESVPFFFLATGWGETMDCTMKSGEPGFIRVSGPGQIEWPDYDGNNMHRSLGNITRNPSVGLLFVKFDGTSLRIRMTGKAEIIEDPAAFAHLPGALRLVRVTADYIYYNCPRSVPKMEMVERSKYLPRAGYEPPDPEWKSRDYIKAAMDE